MNFKSIILFSCYFISPQIHAADQEVFEQKLHASRTQEDADNERMQKAMKAALSKHNFDAATVCVLLDAIQKRQKQITTTLEMLLYPKQQEIKTYQHPESNQQELLATRLEELEKQQKQARIKLQDTGLRIAERHTAEKFN